MTCDQIERRVARFIADNDIPHPGEGPVGVALSGGADSVALLALLCRLGYDCVALHCNFHLRGAESDRDMRHARDTAAALGARFVMTDIDVDGWRARHGGSVEMACRDARYQWFEAMRRDLELTAVAVAHHGDDQAETVVHNLLRGTGIDGLTGMAPVRGHIVRPLLCLRRADIERYLTERGLTYVTDSTNLGCDYTRNKLRNRLFPLIAELMGPGAIEGILSTADHLRETADIAARATRLAIDRASDSRGGIDLDRLADEPMAEAMLYEHLRHEGVSRRMAKDMMDSRAMSGSRFAARGVSYINDHGVLRRAERPVPSAAGGDATDSDSPFDISIITPDEFRPEADNMTAYFDEALLSHRLTWRFRRDGDRMEPFGMRGSKKLSALMRDAHIAIDRKELIPLLIADDSTILFVGGVRASRHFPVTGATRRIVAVRVKCPI